MNFGCVVGCMISGDEMICVEVDVLDFVVKDLFEDVCVVFVIVCVDLIVYCWCDVEVLCF